MALLLLCVHTADTEAIDQGEGRDTILSPTRYPSNTPDITDSESDQKTSQEIPAINTDTIPTKESFIDNHQMTKTSGPIASRTLFSTEDSVVTHDRGESDGAVRARRGNVDRQQRSALPSLETRQRRVITTTVPRDRRRRATAKVGFLVHFLLISYFDTSSLLVDNYEWKPFYRTKHHEIKSSC